MTIQNVTFKNKALDLRLAGQLYLPAEFDGTKNYAAIVVTGPMLLIKEQAPMPKLWMSRMTQACSCILRLKSKN